MSSTNGPFGPPMATLATDDATVVDGHYARAHNLAADTPHFLRAVGILPAVIIFPAIGLNWVWEWIASGKWQGAGSKKRKVLPTLLIAIWLTASMLLTIRDYERYSHDPETAYLFEAAASDLAADIQQEATDTVVFVTIAFGRVG